MQLQSWFVLLLHVSLGSAMYDRALTVFSPQGELLQVTYAEEAARRGSPVAAASNGRDCIALCVAAPPWLGSHEDGGDQEDTDTTNSSLSLLANSSESHRQKLCKVDEHVWLAFAGLSADGRVLVGKVRLECQQYRYTYGTAPPVEHVTRFVSEMQHRYTRLGGARPFGVSCIVVGFDEEGHPRVFRNDPSGSFAEWRATATGKDSPKAMEVLEAKAEGLAGSSGRELAELAAKAALRNGGYSGRVLLMARKSEAVTTRWFVASKHNSNGEVKLADEEASTRGASQ